MRFGKLRNPANRGGKALGVGAGLAGTLKIRQLQKLSLGRNMTYTEAASGLSSPITNVK